MDAARYHRKQTGYRCAGTYSRTLANAVCLLLLIWGAVGVCRCIGQTWRHCRAVRAACRLFCLLAAGTADRFQW